jgi:hypothetical protein
MRRFIPFILICSFSAFAESVPDDNGDEYFKLLSIAQKTVVSRRARPGASDATIRRVLPQNESGSGERLRAALPPTARLALNERRFFKSGESWSVEFTPNSTDEMARGEALPQSATPQAQTRSDARRPAQRHAQRSEEKQGAVMAPYAALSDLSSAPLSEARNASGRRTKAKSSVIFDYKVLFVDADKTDKKKGAHIEIRPSKSATKAEDWRADASIESMEITVNRSFVVVHRTLHFRDGRAPVSLATDDVSNISLGFSAFPVDLPNLGTPANLESSDSGEGVTEFKWDDLYARPMQAVWKDGDVWPELVRSPAGTAVLVRTREEMSK